MPPDPPSAPTPAPTFVVAAVCLRDGRGHVLAVRKRGTGAFMLPGGKLEPGESAAAAAVREVAEEVGLGLPGVTPLGHWVADAANEPGHLVDSTVFVADLPGEPVAAGEIDELRWLDPADPTDGGALVVAPLLLDFVLPALSPVTVVGVGADGWPGLADDVRARVLAAPVVLGAERTLALLPPAPGQERRAWPTPFSVAAVDDFPGRPVLVLATGDPLVSGVATTIVRRVGAARVEVLPAVSSVALARARLCWSAEETTVLRDHRALPRHLAPGHRVLVLSADASTPAVVAALLVGAGFGASRLTVLGDLGAASETRVDGTALGWSGPSPQLNVVAVECRGPAGAGSWASGLPDDAFEHDGQLTKRDLRAGALARLAPRPGDLLWDVGAGAGSVGIEWLRAHPTCRAVAVEADDDRAARIGRNALALGVPALRVVVGRAPEALRADLPDPDAVFVGGGATAPGLLDLVRARLRPGGRLVVHGVTLETEQVLAAAYAEHGGELVRVAVETASPIGSFTGWAPARAVTQWSWTKPEDLP